MDLPLMSDPNLLTGLEKAEDAGVYKLTDELAIVQTVDFFTPIVDDPRTFGQIAAVNSLSDVYAMGGKPLTAMNIVCFPVKTMDMSVLREILLGGLDKMREAKVTLVGGHSIEDKELKYGLSVTGLIHPEKVVYNIGAKAGDRLLLTKALGTGIISTALKGGMADEAVVAGAVNSMVTLNDRASEIMMDFHVHACTDVTGFGLLGHACEMVQGSGVGAVFDSSAIPVLPGTRELIDIGMIPGGTYRNRDFRKDMVEQGRDVPVYFSDILFDPQTSGGLLIAVASDEADQLLDKMRDAGIGAAAIVGEIVEKPEGKILVR
jgi:selenide,water dikinase